MMHTPLRSFRSRFFEKMEKGRKSPTFDDQALDLSYYRPMDKTWCPSPDLFDDNAVDEDDLWTSAQRPLDSIPLLDTQMVNQLFDATLGQPDNTQRHELRRELFKEPNNQWLSKQPNKENVDIDSTQEASRLWTFIYRGPEPKFDNQSRVQCLYVDHGDHFHFIFQSSPQNKMRAFNRLIQAAHIAPSLALSSTIQPVINWNRFAAYLVRDENFRVIVKGNQLQHLRTDLLVVPREAQDCATLLRNERGTKQKIENIKRHRRGDVIKQLIEQYDARSIHELTNSLSYQDRWDLYNEFGNLWQETAKLGCKCYCENLRKYQESTPFAEYIKEKNHNRVCTNPSDTTPGEEWLDKLLEVNRIPKWEILSALVKIMDRSLLRTNALVIEGPTTTGMFRLSYITL